MKKYAVIGTLALLAGLLIYSGPLFEGKLAASSAANRFLGFTAVGQDDLEVRIASLEEENERLRNLLEGQDNETVKVYSSHPFNTRGEIAIAAGARDGVKEGDAVVTEGSILVGRVRSVFENVSIVTTIFDPSWEVQARIGEREVDTLMQGGNELHLALIPQEEFIETGDKVVVASKDFPYGLELGFVGAVEKLPGDVFQQATLEPILQLKTLRNVTVYR